MRIAFTGSSSTGKTTLANKLQEDTRFCELSLEFITVDARKLLEERGFKSMDRMITEEKIKFQAAYLEKKLVLENGRDSYFTDRSFIDVASYWLELDKTGLPASDIDSYIERCRQEVGRYDLHFYFPYGLFPFESDGYRSEQIDLHERIDSRICQFISEWGCKVMSLDVKDLGSRCDAVIDALQGQL